MLTIAPNGRGPDGVIYMGIWERPWRPLSHYLPITVLEQRLAATTNTSPRCALFMSAGGAGERNQLSTTLSITLTGGLKCGN